jgi:hypothetical protein
MEKSNSNTKTHKYYESSQTNYYEVDGKAEGKRKVVKIENGVGMKKVELLGEKGKVMNSKIRKLSKDEIKNITNNNFVPGLWSNCKLGKCSNTTRKNNKNVKTIKNKRR